MPEVSKQRTMGLNYNERLKEILLKNFKNCVCENFFICQLLVGSFEYYIDLRCWLKFKIFKDYHQAILQREKGFETQHVTV